MAGFATATGPGAVPVLLVSGDLDLSGEQELLDHAARLLTGGAGVLDVDLAEVTFIDSSGLGALVRAHHLAADAGRQLRLASVPGPVARILDLTGLRDIFVERPPT
jgi:anti-sigma B factor antagonist